MQHLHFLGTTARTKFTSSIFCILIVLCSTSASAVTLIEDNRNFTIRSTSGTSTLTPPTPFADWSTSRQTSSVSEDAFSGMGNGYGELDPSIFIIKSTFDVAFGIDVATRILLSGTLSGDDGDFGLGESQVSLFSVDGGSQSLLYFEFGGSGSTVNFVFDDLLSEGIYQLVLTTRITAGGCCTTGRWDFTAEFIGQPVPIPAMGWLMGLAVMGLWRSSKQR